MKEQLMLTIVLAALLTLTASCSLSASPTKWEKFTFNGQDFQTGRFENSPSIWTRAGYTPRIKEPDSASRDSGKLPPKTGAVAGICYLQTSGGKIAVQSGAIPLPHEQITFRNREFGTSVTSSDVAGFFIKELFPGDYQLFCRGAVVDVRAIEGQTVLVPIRGGKRMAD
jgi:hypothetical protein